MSKGFFGGGLVRFKFIRGCQAMFCFFVLLNMVGLPDAVFAKVSGPCSNCHTMHNSQNGTFDENHQGVSLADGPYGALTKGDCVGCHSASGNTTIVNLGETTRVPIVNSAASPTYPPTGSSTSSLAAGNFYWVVQNGDAYGHNCLSVPGIEQDVALAAGAPGMPTSTSGNNECMGCHTRIDGCGSCHNPAHHADDTNAESPVVAETGGWYRFLHSQKHGGTGGLARGVIGIEDDDWEQTVSSTDHNEYMGATQLMSSGEDNSMSDYCAGCHQKFHGLDNAGFGPDGSYNEGQSPWYIHPTHLPLPVDPDKEYRLYNTADGENMGPYSPEAPVARNPSTMDSRSGASSLVEAGQDQVFCLSCHRVHGSPYEDILRWEYSAMVTANPSEEAKGHGCFVCHTTKDQ